MVDFSRCVLIIGKLIHLCVLSLSLPYFLAGESINKSMIIVATNVHYKRAIIQAIDELQDFNLRSTLDAVRRHVQASFGPEHLWNDTVFLKTLKTLAYEGDIEQCTSLNCGLSPEFKQRRTSTMKALLEQRSQLHTLPPSVSYPFFTNHHVFEVKEAPVRKPEHFKPKIIPKKTWDKQ